MKSIIQTLLELIPDFQNFYTMDEFDASSRQLAVKYPDHVTLLDLGKTREGHSILCLKIGNGSKNALMFGCPHPNEPIGSMLLEYFADALASKSQIRSAFDFTWYLVKVWDVDGYRLNEGWLKGPFNLYQYSRNVFRPAGNAQVDWSFPVDHKKMHWTTPLPETEVMMHLIDEIEPVFTYSLHNSGFSGVYWYLTKEMETIYDSLRAVPEKFNIPVHVGEAEGPEIITFSKAVYSSEGGIRHIYDFMEELGEKNPENILKVGTTSSDYSQMKFNTVTLITELPYFYDERVGNSNLTNILRRNVALEKLDWNEKADQFLMDSIRSHGDLLQKDNPFMLAIKSFSSGSYDASAKKAIETDPAYNVKASVAEVFDNLLTSKFYKLLSFGMLVRMYEYELNQFEQKQYTKESIQKKEFVLRLKKALIQADDKHKQLCEDLERELHYKVIPIKTLVAIQLESGMICASEVEALTGRGLDNRGNTK